MNCNQCRAKLVEYIEGSLSMELDEEIRNHLLGCESCKSYYDKELIEYKAFRDAFSSENVGFEFSKDKIMNSIDKTRYMQSGVNKKFKYKGAIAAALLVGLIVTPLTLKLINSDKNSVPETASAGVEARLRIPVENDDNKVIADEELGAVPDLSIHSSDDTNNGQNREINSNKVDLYSKVDVPITHELTFNTPFIATSDSKYEATIEGKGKTAIEEGIGTIYIKDKVNNKMYKYEISDPNNLQGNQISPLSISWYDNTHVMVVQGGGYGTLVNGNEIIVINVVTGEQIRIGLATDKERFISVEKVGNDLKIKGIKYLDDSLNEYEDMEKIIPNYNLGDLIE